MDRALRREILTKALLTRRFEERVIQLSMAGEIPATLHPGAGQELAQVAALAALRPDDPMLYGHRGAGYWIARGLPLETILCDIAGKEGGSNRGKGGVMHVVDPSRAILGESGTLGGNFVVGAGVALAEQMQGRPTVTILFFGEGTSNRGQFHEAANFVAVKKLPCIFFCENNGWAVSVAASVSTAVEDIADRAAGYAMPGTVVDGSDIEAVYRATRTAAERARCGGGPSLIEAKVERLLGHFLGDAQPYRSPAESQALKARDPLPRALAAAVRDGVFDEAELEALEADYRDQIERAVAFCQAQPLVPTASAREHVYAS